MADFTLPELGENITAGDVLNVLVKVGDTVARDQAVLELETDKATIEVPSSISGKVTAIKVKAGDKVKVGQAILSLDDNGAGTAPDRAGCLGRIISARRALRAAHGARTGRQHRRGCWHGRRWPDLD